MTIEITQEVVSVANEFTDRTVKFPMYREAAMLQEIVMLRKKNDALEYQLTSLEARLSLAYQELVEVANEALSK